MILRIHHVQLAMPADGEGTGVAFYGEDPFGNRLEILAEDTRRANAGPADQA